MDAWLVEYTIPYVSAIMNKLFNTKQMMVC